MTRSTTSPAGWTDALLAPDSLEELNHRLGGRFSDDDSQLQLALAHRSWCAEHPPAASNERLEFLGDAVLGLVVTAHLYVTYPELPEGELAKVRASVVSAVALAEVATELELGKYILLGKGEDGSGGREKSTILADALEAVIGALYIDQGWEAAEGLILELLGERIAIASKGPGGQDYKTRLQELATRTFTVLPRYSVVDEGPDHAKRFLATVQVDGTVYGTGEGRSKKQAEQAAARAAWERLLVDQSDGQQPIPTPAPTSHPEDVDA